MPDVPVRTSAAVLKSVDTATVPADKLLVGSHCVPVSNLGDTSSCKPDPLSLLSAQRMMLRLLQALLPQAALQPAPLELLPEGHPHLRPLLLLRQHLVNIRTAVVDAEIYLRMLM